MCGPSTLTLAERELICMPPIALPENLPHIRATMDIRPETAEHFYGLVEPLLRSPHNTYHHAAPIGSGQMLAESRL